MKNARPHVIRAVLALALAAGIGIIGPRPADAQAVASLVPMPRAQFFSASGVPLAGGCVWTYAAGSSTPLNSYKNAAGSANQNPVVLDSAGRADIWLGAGSAYKISVSAKTSAGCVAATTPLYTADNVIDQGFALARSLQTGSLTIGLRGLPITGQGGGVGVGNAVLSATTDGLYVSVNGAAPVLLSGGGGTGGGAAAGPATSVQYNNGGSFGGTANMKWDNGGKILVICGAPSTGCSPNSGVEAPTFSAFGAASDNAFETNVNGGPGGESHVTMDGNAYFQGVNVTNTFNSLATGGTSAIQQVNGTFRITGGGDFLGQTLALGLHASPTTGVGGYPTNPFANALLSATSAGMYISLNGATPVLIGGGGGSGTPGTPTTSVQFNNAGAFAGSANLSWDSGNNILIVCKAPGTGCSSAVGSGIESPVFSSFGAAADSAFVSNVTSGCTGCSHITNDGNAYFQGVNVTATFNSLATGTTSAIQQATGTFRVTGAGDFLGQTLALGLHASPTTGIGGYPGNPNANALLSATSAGMYISLNGAAPVLIGGGGGSGTPGAPTTSIQYNNAGTFAGNAALNWDNTNTVLNSPVFSCTTTAATYCFKTSSGNAQIRGDGAMLASTFFANTVFQSLATGAVQAFTTAGSPGAAINGQGDSSFRSLSIAGGSYGLNNAGQLTVSSCIGCVGAAAGANTQVQFNNGGVFGASANLTFGGGVLTVGGGNTTGVTANTFTGVGAGGPTLAFQTAGNTWQVDAAGDSSQKGSLSLNDPNPVINFISASANRSLSFSTGTAISNSQRWLFGTNNNAETGANAGSNFFLNRYSDAGTYLDSPIFIARANGVITMGDGWAVGSYGLTTAGALTVASCTGCGAGGVPPGGSFQQVQYNNGTTTSFGATASFNWDIANSVLNSPVFSCTTTGAAYCFKTSSGNASIQGNGQFAGQSIALGGNNGTSATAGQGGTIANAGAAGIGLVVYDTNGHCNLGSAGACSSDERLKKNIAPIGDALKAVTALRPVSFDWRGNGEHSFGFIAQDVQKVLPGLVTTDKGGYLELSEINMIPYLVRSIQQLQAEVDALRSRSGVAALYDQLSK